MCDLQELLEMKAKAQNRHQVALNTPEDEHQRCSVSAET